jgi:hypothetical protein
VGLSLFWIFLGGVWFFCSVFGFRRITVYLVFVSMWLLGYWLFWDTDFLLPFVQLFLAVWVYFVFSCLWKQKPKRKQKSVFGSRESNAILALGEPDVSGVVASKLLWRFFIFFIPAAIVQLKSHICSDAYTTQVRDIRLLLLVMLVKGAVSEVSKRCRPFLSHAVVLSLHYE